MPRPAINASTRATMEKFASVCVSLPAAILPANSSISASCCRSPFRKLLVFGNCLSSMHTPAIPRCSSLRTRRRRLLKLPYPVSPSSKIGKSLASAMNSSISTTCVQLASLLSRTPNCAEIDSPDAQMPLKPASRTMRADRPLCASIRNSSSGLCSIVRSFSLRVTAPRPRSASKGGSFADLDGEKVDAFMVSLRLQLGQNLSLGTGHILRKIDLDPGQPGHVRHVESMIVLADQVPDRLLVRHIARASRHIAGHNLRETTRPRLVEAEKTDRLPDGVILQIGCDALAQLHGRSPAQTQLHGLIARLEVTVHEHPIHRPWARHERFQDLCVIKNIGIHEEHVTAAREGLRRGVHREHAAQLEARVDHDFRGRRHPHTVNLRLDELALETESQNDLRNAALAQHEQMPLEQGLAAETQKTLGNLLVFRLLQPLPPAGCA